MLAARSGRVALAALVALILPAAVSASRSQCPPTRVFLLRPASLSRPLALPSAPSKQSQASTAQRDKRPLVFSAASRAHSCRSPPRPLPIVIRCSSAHPRSTQPPSDPAAAQQASSPCRTRSAAAACSSSQALPRLATCLAFRCPPSLPQTFPPYRSPHIHTATSHVDPE